MKELDMTNYVPTKVDVPELEIELDNTAYIEGQTDEKVYNRVKKYVEDLDKE